jgi:SAM-dependent methyltransferase
MNPLSKSSTSTEIVFADNAVRMPWHDCRRFRQEFASAYGAEPFSDRTFTIWKCCKCGMGFTEPVPTPETSHLLYESRESSDFQPDNSGLMFRLKRWSAIKDVRSFLAGMPLPENPAILDFSCGDGMFTLAMKAACPGARVAGTDMHPEPPPLLSSETYFGHDKLENQAEAWDMVLFRHVLEHSYEPVEMLVRLRKLLRPQGILAIEVPSLETKVASLFGKHWDGYYTPYHPVHFTSASLAAALKAAGFTVVREGFAEMPKMGRSLRNVLGCKYNLALFAMGMALQPVQSLLGKVTATSVCLRIWGQKLNTR